MVLKAKWFGVGGGAIGQAAELAPVGSKRILWFLPLFITLGVTVHSMFRNKRYREWKTPLTAFFILSLIYFTATVFSQRFIEYLAPVATVFIFLYWNRYPSEKFAENSAEKKAAVKYSFFIRNFHIIVCTILLAAGTVSTYMLYKNFYRKSLFYGRSAEWLRKNIPENSIIFTGDWDIAAVLFCNAPQFRYLVMLEPYFMYAYSPEKYFLWHKICSGKISDIPVQIVSEFKSEVVFIPHDKPALKRKLILDDSAELQFEGEYGESIFTLSVPEKELLKARQLKEWLKQRKKQTR
jgi:hypothetical protein